MLMIKVNFLCADLFLNTFLTSFLLQVPFNVALKNKTSEDVSLLVIDSIVDGNKTFQHAEYDFGYFQ